MKIGQGAPKSVNKKASSITRITNTESKINSLLHPKISKTDEQILQLSVMLHTFLYPATEPVLGTIAFWIKLLHLEPFDIINLIKNQDIKRDSKARKDKILVAILDIWDTLDYYSKKRYDLFDILVKKARFTIGSTPLSTKELWGYLFQYLSEFSLESVEAAKVLLEMQKLILVSKVSAKTGDDSKANTLMAEMTGLKKPTNIEVNQNNNTLNIADRPQVNKVSNQINRALALDDLELETNENRLLTEGQQNYIDADYTLEKDKEVA